MTRDEAAEVILLWVVRAVIIVTGVMSGAVTLGLAWRLFEFIRG